jgi:hypothetical protein
LFLFIFSKIAMDSQSNEYDNKLLSNDPSDLSEESTIRLRNNISNWIETVDFVKFFNEVNNDLKPYLYLLKDPFSERDFGKYLPLVEYLYQIEDLTIFDEDIKVYLPQQNMKHILINYFTLRRIEEDLAKISEGHIILLEIPDYIENEKKYECYHNLAKALAMSINTIKDALTHTLSLTKEQCAERDEKGLFSIAIAKFRELLSN